MLRLDDSTIFWLAVMLALLVICVSVSSALILRRGPLFAVITSTAVTVGILLVLYLIG
jgi:hypothetical protein